MPKETIVPMTAKKLRGLETEINAIAQRYGVEVFDLWVTTNGKGSDSDDFGLYDLNITFRKEGWKERGETPESVRLAQHFSQPKKEHPTARA
jgi:uncharacterized OsmC-like protein